MRGAEVAGRKRLLLRRVSPWVYRERKELSVRGEAEADPTNAGSLSWRRLAGAELRWKYLDDKAIVFDSESGQTHLLDALSAATLKEFEHGPRTITQLVRSLSSRFGLDSEELSDRLETICGRFEELGLTELESS